MTTFRIAFLAFMGVLCVLCIPAVLALQKRVRASQVVEAEACAAREGLIVDTDETTPLAGFDLPVVEVGAAAFQKRSDVASADERFATALLDRTMIAWLLDTDIGKGATRFEVSGEWLVCISKRLDFDQMMSFLDEARKLARHAPTALTDEYPVA